MTTKDNSPSRDAAMGDKMATQTGGAGPEGQGVDVQEALTKIEQEERERASAIAAGTALAAAGVKMTGSARGIELLRQHFDPNASVLFAAWPKRGASRVVKWDFVLVEIADARRIVIVQDNEDGSFRFFAEVPGRGDEKLITNLTGFYAD